MDSKYGPLYTLDDVKLISQALGPVEDAIERLHAQGLLTFPADEPLFVLRGNNRAHSTALAFLSELLENRESGEQADHVLAASNEMHIWQAANPDRVKTPDA
jgi:hypothetical protein